MRPKRREVPPQDAPGRGERSSGTAPATAPPGVAIARLVALRAGTEAVLAVDRDGVLQPIVSRTATVLAPADVGRDVAVIFEGGDSRRAIVIGVVRPWPTAAAAAGPDADGGAPPHDLVVDGERIVLAASRELVLRCGKATITLTRAGKIVIRGAYVSTSSSGVNRIKGGSVQIN